MRALVQTVPYAPTAATAVLVSEGSANVPEGLLIKASGAYGLWLSIHPSFTAATAWEVASGEQVQIFLHIGETLYVSSSDTGGFNDAEITLLATKGGAPDTPSAGGGGGGVTDHGALTGLADDDHPHYFHTTDDSAADVPWDVVGTAFLDDETTVEAALLELTNATTDPRIIGGQLPDDYLYIDYDNLSGTFSAAETITGGTSGVTATVISDTGSRLYIQSLTGDFLDNEVITGGTSGATADVNGVVDGGVQMEFGKFYLWINGAATPRVPVATYESDPIIQGGDFVPELITAPILLQPYAQSWESLETSGAQLYYPAVKDVDYDNEAGGPFTVGEVITGGTSGATATISRIKDDGTTGILAVEGVVGTFVNNEEITGGTSGATADVNGSPAGQQGFLWQPGTATLRGARLMMLYPQALFNNEFWYGHA